MKNLLIFISPTKSFNNPRLDFAANDFDLSVKVQIENSFELGWKKEDIWLFTNFPFEYAGIKAQVFDDVHFFDRKPQGTKINAIIKLFDRGIIKEDELYWFHDLDTFQICSTSELTINIRAEEIALTDYGWADRWSTGVIYFKNESKDIFEKIKEKMYEKSINEEVALTILTRSNNNIQKRTLKINKTYNFTPRHIKINYARSEKPIKVLHFHPLGKVSRSEQYNSFHYLNGENPLNIKFIPDRLLKIFRYHRIR